MDLERVLYFIKEKRGYKIPIRYKLSMGFMLEKHERNINDDLNLSNFSKEHISQIEYISGDFYLGSSEVTTISDLRFVRGSLHGEFSQLRKLPDNLKVDGFLDLEDCPITKLPNKLEVGNNLIASYSWLDSIPSYLSIGGDLIIIDTPLSRMYSKEEIRKIIESRGGYVKGKIYVRESDF